MHSFHFFDFYNNKNNNSKSKLIRKARFTKTEYEKSNIISIG
jgi:hypothetical protein